MQIDVGSSLTVFVYASGVLGWYLYDNEGENCNTEQSRSSLTIAAILSLLVHCW